MESSPALDKKYLEEKFDIGVMEVELTEMRQKKHSGILKNASDIRAKIKSRQYDQIHLPSHDDVTKINPIQIIDLCAESFNPSRFNCMMITHMTAFFDYNLKIRDKIFPNG